MLSRSINTFLSVGAEWMDRGRVASGATGDGTREDVRFRPRPPRNKGLERRLRRSGGPWCKDRAVRRRIGGRLSEWPETRPETPGPIVSQDGRTGGSRPGGPPRSARLPRPCGRGPGAGVRQRRSPTRVISVTAVMLTIASREICRKGDPPSQRARASPAGNRSGIPRPRCGSRCAGAGAAPRRCRREGGA